MKKGKKRLILIGIIIATILAIVFVAVIANRGYRVIKVASLEGDVTLEREAKEKDVFEGMNLQSEDVMTIGDVGLLGLAADEDKYITAIENTCFEIVSQGTEEEGKLEIKLRYGTTLIEIENKLLEGASFEVQTPNATLSVRGTIFEVTYIPESNTTILKVIEGIVEVVTVSENRMISAGSMAIITDEHIEVEDMDGMASAIIPDGSVENELIGEVIHSGGGSKEYINLDELPALLKGSPERGMLGDLIAVAKYSQDEGNADYISTALRQMCFTTGSDGLYLPISAEAGNYVYDIATLNESFSFLTDEKIGEEHLYGDSYMDGDQIVCVQPIDEKIGKGINATVMEAYYVENGEIIVGAVYNTINYDDLSTESVSVTVHLVPGEDGKYIFSYIE